MVFSLELQGPVGPAQGLKRNLAAPAVDAFSLSLEWTRLMIEEGLQLGEPMQSSSVQSFAEFTGINDFVYEKISTTLNTTECNERYLEVPNMCLFVLFESLDT